MADGEDIGAKDRLAEVTRRQRAVSDPATSAWVSANAGSGKTHVLIQRVTRLLLAGNAPAQIVCITYTKAAAAEMADRLFRQLGTWALLEDDALRGALAQVIGADDAQNADLAMARQLFARALETPGGLKIQTIHAFCELVLRRFPAEAGLLPGFEVMEDADAKTAIAEIVDRLAERALAEDGVLIGAFDSLGATYKPVSGMGFGFQTSLQDVLRGFADKRLAVARAHDAVGGVEEFVRGLYARHDLTGEESEAAIREAACDAADTMFLREVADAFSVGGTRALATRSDILAYLETGPRSFALLTDIALTQRLEPRKASWWGKACGKVANFESRWAELAEGVRAAHEALDALEFCRINAALHRLGAEVIAAYEKRKTRLGRLDFEDLIDRTARLLADTSNAWVHYKLDQGIAHVLLDEAQDTAGSQWDVVQALTAEFFAGEGVERETPRTLFVVGDEKQSIYSFQGADAALFDEKFQETKAQAGEDRFAARPFGLSFRTTAPVLAFVDEVFAQDGLMDRYEDHQTRFPEIGGSVEVWPSLERTETPGGQPWDTPIDEPAPDDPRRQLADAICERIKGWTEGAEPLANPSRRVRPGDILILCQTRGPQFHEIVSALSRHGIPAAGADKVRLKDDVAVRDLWALLRFATNRGDCLSLAELLRSPLWGITEDDLYALAQPRDGWLWDAVKTRAAGEDALAAKCAKATAEIEAALTEGRRAGPFALLSAILERGHPTGRRRIARRLGRVPDEALDELLAEALDWEGRHSRTVEGFLDHLETFDGEVKKEQGKDADDAGGPGAVRVMTVHGAKGLEAPIVFLADATYKKGAADVFKRNPLVPLGAPGPGVFTPDPGSLVAVPASRADGTPPVLAAKAHADDRRMAEYRRLFYVAATRAAERLVVCGVDKKGRDADADPDQADWHALAEKAVRRLGAVEAEGPLGPVLRYETGRPLAGGSATAPQVFKAYEAPSWLTELAPGERAPRAIIPSKGPLEADEDPLTGGTQPEEDDGPAYPPRLPGQGQEPYLRGNVLHRLLERLPDVPPERRRDVGTALIASMMAKDDRDDASAWLDEAMAVLDDSRFLRVFGQNSLAEVPIVGRVGGRAVRGQVDRLLVTPEEIVIVDFKSNRPPPSDPADVRPAVLFQLAAYEALLARVYPGRAIRTALLWTYAPRLMPIASEMLAGRLD